MRAAISIPKRLNLGCGWDIRADYLNVDLHDFHKPDLVADITTLPDLPNGYFQHIVAQDVLEHIERGKTVPVLTRWAELLESNGTIFIRVPSLTDVLKLLARAETVEREHEIIHLIYGTQAYTGDFHLAGFTAATLASQLAEAGLMICEARLRDEWLFEVVARKTNILTEPSELVHNAYFTVLRRPVDPSGLDHFCREVRSGLSYKDLCGMLRE